MAINDGKRWSKGSSAIRDGCQVQLNSKRPSTFPRQPFHEHQWMLKLVSYGFHYIWK
jgi:hypothetical protein